MLEKSEILAAVEKLLESAKTSTSVSYYTYDEENCAARMITAKMKIVEQYLELIRLNQYADKDRIDVT